MKAAGEIIYLVDDDPRVREGLAELFASLEMMCATFASALDFLGYVRTDTCACLVLDIQLPGLNGLDLQRQLGDDSSPPIIFISGCADIPSTVRAMKAGAVEFLTKPLDPDMLVAAIRAAFAKDLQWRQTALEMVELRRRLALLTPREREVLPLLVGGMLNKQAAAWLGISEVTLQVHRGQVMRKMAAASFADLVRMAGKLGLPASERIL